MSAAARTLRGLLRAVENRFPAIQPPTGAEALELPQTPFRFCGRYLGIYGLTVLLIVVFEAGQAACAILLPYAIKRIMDAVALAQGSGGDVWQAVYSPLWLFAWLNLGVLLFFAGERHYPGVARPRTQAPYSPRVIRASAIAFAAIFFEQFRRLAC